MAESIEDLDLTPPQAAQENAQKVLDWRDEHGDEVKGMTRTGWVRANQLAEGEELSPDIVKRMSSFNRHRSNSDLADEYEGEPWKDAGYVAWLGWGGDEGIDWAMRMSDRIQSMENSGRDKVTTLSHKHDSGEESTVENQSIKDRIGGESTEASSADVPDSKTISANTYNGYFKGKEFDDENWMNAVDRLRELQGIAKSFITRVVQHEKTGHEREENVPVFEEPIDADTLDQFVQNVEDNVDEETFENVVEDINTLDDTIRRLFFRVIMHDDFMHDRDDFEIEQLLSEEELKKGEDYDTIAGCMDFHVGEKDMDKDQAFAVCASEFDVEENSKEEVLEEYKELDEVSEGDKVRWDSSGGNAYGVVDTVETDGTVSAEPEGPDMEGSDDEPAVKVQVYGIEDDEWTATETFVVHRQDSLEVIDSFPEQRSNSEILQQGMIPNHRPLGNFGTRESEDWSRPSYSEFKSAYDLESNFSELPTEDKRTVAAHFGRVDNSSYEDATYSDLQLPHHHPDTGDVDRAAVIAARQRLPQSDMPQEDLEAIDTHLSNHLRDDFDEEDVEPIIEKENAAERNNVFRDADKAVRKAREMGIKGIHTMKEDGETFYKPGATPEDFEQARRENSESLSEGQLVSFSTDYGKSFGRVKENTEQQYEIEVYQAELGGGWKSSGNTKTLTEKELTVEDQFPDSLNDVFNNDGGVEAETLEENDEELSEHELGEEEEFSEEG